MTEFETNQENIAQTKKTAIEPFFDFFGVSPKFYIRGRTKAMTWLGCVCSGMLVISLFTIFLIYFQDFINKRESLITSLKLRTGDYLKINLQEKEQVLMLENWPPELDYKSYLEISYSLTTRDKNHQIVSQKPLSTVPCSGVTIEGEKI